MKLRLAALFTVVALLMLACSAGTILGTSADNDSTTNSAPVSPDTEESTPDPAESVPADETTESGATVLTGSCANTYYPIVEGQTWHYTITTPESPPVHLSISYSDVTESGFTVHEWLDDVLAGEIAWTCTGDGLIASEYVNIDLINAGYAITTNDVVGASIPPQAQMVAGGSWQNEFFATAFYPTDVGDATSDLHVVEHNTVVGADSVSAAIGSYDNALKINTEGQITINTVIAGFSTGDSTINITSTNWVVEGLGLVRQEANAEGVITVMELTSID